MCAWIIEQQIQQQQQNNSDLLISVPHKGAFSARWVMGFHSLKIPFPNSPTIILEAGQPVDVSRNIAVTKALQVKAKYLFFIDSDVILNSDTLEQLAVIRMPITSACYRSRGEPYSVLANIDNKQVDEKLLADGNVTFIKVHQVGLGCCLIDTRVFRNIAAKLNEWRCFVDHAPNIGKEVAVYDDATAIKNEYKCEICKQSLVARFFWSRSGMQNVNAVSEDYWFCHLARQQSFPVVIRPNVWVNHEASFMEVSKEGLINPLRSVAAVE